MDLGSNKCQCKCITHVGFQELLKTPDPPSCGRYVSKSHNLINKNSLGHAYGSKYIQTSSNSYTCCIFAPINKSNMRIHVVCKLSEIRYHVSRMMGFWFPHVCYAGQAEPNKNTKLKKGNQLYAPGHTSRKTHAQKCMNTHLFENYQSLFIM